MEVAAAARFEGLVRLIKMAVAAEVAITAEVAIAAEMQSEVRMLSHSLDKMDHSS